MTLALIALIVFFSIWGYQVVNNKAKRIEERKKSKTNIPLQKQIFKKNFKKISDELNNLPFDITFREMYDYLDSRRDFYGVPREFELSSCHEADRSVIDSRMRTLEQDQKDYVSWYSNDPIFREIFPINQSDVSEKAIDSYRRKASEIRQQGGLEVWLAKVVWGSIKDVAVRPHVTAEYLINYLIREDIIEQCAEQLPDVEPKHISAAVPPMTNAERILLSSPARAHLISLVTEISEKEIYEQGYHYSRTWEDSFWQQAEKRHGKVEEYKKKYPWK